MIYSKLRAIVICGLAIYLLLACMESCHKSPGVEENGVDKVHADSMELAKIMDSISYYALVLGDTDYCYKAIRPFFNIDLANRHPWMVSDAFVTALIARMALSSDLSGDNFTANLLRQMKMLADSTQQPTLKTWYKYVVARYYCDIDEYLHALPMLLAVYDEFEQQHDSNGQSVASKRIGVIYMRSYNDYDNAIYYFRKAREIYDDPVEKAKNTFFLFYCYSALDDVDSINSYYAQVLKLDTSLLYKVDFLTVRTLYHISLFDKASRSSNDSIDYYLDLVEKASEPSNLYFTENLLHIKSRYAKALLKKKEWTKAGNVLEAALAHDTSHYRISKSIVDLWESRYKYYSAIGNLEEAVKNFETYNTKAARFNSEDTKAKIEQAKIEFENEQEKLQLKNEQEEKEAISQKQIREEKMIRNVLIGGSVLLILFIVVLVNRNKLKRTIEMERMRNRLSRDLHDDIGSTLSSINILSRTAQDNLKRSDTENAKLSLEKMNERSQRLLDNMSDIIWNIHPGNDSMEEVMSRMREYATTILEAKNIDYSFDFPDEKTDFRFNMEVKTNIYLIFKEAVNNLSKYSRSSHAILTLSLDEKSVHLKIQDNGIGFNDAELSHRGGLKNMQHRAEEIKGILSITSEQDKGTTVELTFPRHS